LKPGDQIDVLKSDSHSKRFCWLPGRVKKITSLSIHIQLDWDKNVLPLDKKGMFVHPFRSMEAHYLWRSELKEGDFVDFQDGRSVWVNAKVGGKREETDSDGITTEVLLEWEDQSEWLSLIDPRIQKGGSFSGDLTIPRGITESFIDDFNDVLLDPEMRSIGVIRTEYNKSVLLIEFINYAEKELKIFERALAAVQTRKFGIEVTADLVGCIASLHVLLHRKFTLNYLPQMI
jgi:hypothetical protein